MSRWTIDEPTTLDFDGVVALRATLIAGAISVLASDERPSIMIGDVEGPPLVITHEAGMLTVTHEKLWEGVLTWLRTQRCQALITVTVPHDCPVSLNLVSADAVVTGTTSSTSIKSASGDVTLDGVAGAIDANTVSGAIEAQGLDGTVSFTSVSGDLSLAGGSIDHLAARAVSGRIAADVNLIGDSGIDVNTVSGEVALRIPETADAQVTLNSAAGRIETSFPELGRQERSFARSTGGKLGDGTGRLTVNTVSGSITLLGRDDDAPYARRGTAFHAWLEGRWGQQRLLDPDELPGAADEGAADDSHLARLRSRFEESEWASREPLDIEVPFETIIGDRLVRGRMDAVFRSRDGTYEVVDWKTGSPPSGEEARFVSVQLAAYRLAWAELAAVDVAQVSAAFHYVSANVTVRPADLLDAEGLAALLENVPAARGA